MDMGTPTCHIAYLAHMVHNQSVLTLRQMFTSLIFNLISLNEHFDLQGICFECILFCKNEAFLLEEKKIHSWLFKIFELFYFQTHF